MFSTVRGRKWYTDFARASKQLGKTKTILQTDTMHDQMVILYEIHSFRIIDVPGCNDMLPTSQSESALPSTGLTGSCLSCRLSST